MKILQYTIIHRVDVVQITAAHLNRGVFIIGDGRVVPHMVLVRIYVTVHVIQFIDLVVQVVDLVMII
jgi:hypothetical protein